MSDLIVVDIQPEYADLCEYIINSDLIEQIQKSDKVVWYFNGPELGYNDTEGSIKFWLADNGFEEELFDKITFVPKQYGYIRDFIDESWNNNEITEELIIDLLKQLIEKDCGFDEIWTDNDLQMWIDPNELRFDLLRELKDVKICGGSKYECLYEIQLILDALDIKYKTINNLVWH